MSEQTDWFGQGLDLIEPLARRDPTEARRILAARFRQLWSYFPVRGRLLAVARAVLAGGHDDALWFAVRETLGFATAPALALDWTALQDLEQDLRPSGAEDLVATYVFNPNYKFRNEAGDGGKREAEAAAQMATALGIRAAADPNGFARVAEQLLERQQTQALLFAEGYANQTDDLDGMWMRLVDIASSRSVADPAVLMGYLRGAKARDEDRVSRWLDAALGQPGAARHLVALQIAVGLDEAGVARWLAGVSDGRIPVRSFYLAGGAIDVLGPETLGPLLLAIAARPDGLPSAVDLLSMRLMNLGEDEVPAPWADLCRALLATYDFAERPETMLDHHLGELALKGLVGPDGEPVARQVAEAMKAAATDRSRRYDHPSLTRALFRRQPRVALDVLVEAGETWLHLEDIVCGLDCDPDEDPERQTRGPIHALDLAVARAWVAEEPATRTVRLALAVPFAERGADGDLVWTPIAQELLDGPYGVSALEAFYPRFFPSSGWGEIGDPWPRRRPLLAVLRDHPNPALVEAARGFSEALEAKIAWAGAITWRDEDEAFE